LGAFQSMLFGKITLAKFEHHPNLIDIIYLYAP
jgi:hypothetical protein